MRGDIPVERIDRELNEFTRRAGSVLVAHSTTTLGRGLEPGEKVLVRDRGTHVLATVRDISFDLTDTHYRLELGAPVAADEVGLLLAEAPRFDGDGADLGADLGDVLALLHEARALTAERSYLANARTH